MLESDAIIKYLFTEYGDGEVSGIPGMPFQLLPGIDPEPDSWVPPSSIFSHTHNALGSFLLCVSCLVWAIYRNTL